MTAALGSWCEFANEDRLDPIVELLETDNAGSARRPRIAFDSANNALAVWHQSDGSVLNIWSNYYTAGVAWGTAEKIEIEDTGNAVSPRVNFDANGNQQPTTVYSRVPALSAGISLRVNLFGAIILEPYYAIPFNRTDIKTGVFGLNFTPGW